MPNRRIKRKEKVLFACSFIVFTTLLMLLIPTLSYSQLTLSNVGANYTTLATSLTSDPNVVISNASGKRRSNKQMAFFFNPGGNNLQVTSGIVLTTGDIEASNKVLNTEGDFTGDHSEFPMNPADQQLLSVSFPGAEIYDYAILEFDLKINNGSGVQFNYVFASEEYPEYVCAHFDDAFGLWIKGGTEYPDYTNIALTPVGDLLISINYLNNGVRGYYGNDCPTGWNLNRNYYINNYNGRDLEADGLTSRLTSNLELTPNVTYRFKIGISDISDNALDSWVYIEANFTTLPVNVISFEGKSDLDGYTRLVWNVANERNFSHYMVQRSKDPVNGFEDLQSVKGTGGVLYNFLDYSGSDDYYYRLKLVDLDGSTTYSDIVFVKSVDIAEVFQIFPKEEKVYLKYDASNTQLSTVVVYNTSGQIVFSKEIVMNEGLNEFELEDLNLATGAYLATLINENTVIRTKFIK